MLHPLPKRRGIRADFLVNMDTMNWMAQDSQVVAIHATAWHLMAVSLVASADRAVTSLPAPNGQIADWRHLYDAVRKRWQVAPNYSLRRPRLVVGDQIEREAALADYELVCFRQTAQWPRLPVDYEMDRRERAAVGSLRRYGDVS